MNSLPSRVSAMPENLRCLLPYAVALVSIGSALAQAPQATPAVVRDALSEMSQDCRDAGGVPKKAPKLLVIAELTKDAWPDYIINQGAFNCEGAASLFSGSGGSEVSIYVGTPDGQAFPAFSSGALDVRIDRTTMPNRLQLLVGGPLCGEQAIPARSRSALTSCWRPVVWNFDKKKMEWAPLSQIQSAE